MRPWFYQRGNRQWLRRTDERVGGSKLENSVVGRIGGIHVSLVVRGLEWEYQSWRKDFEYRGIDSVRFDSLRRAWSVFANVIKAEAGEMHLNTRAFSIFIFGVFFSHW